MQNNAMLITSTTSEFVYTGTAYLTGLYISSPLVGTLTIRGIANDTGASGIWVIPVGAVGTVFTNAKITTINPKVGLSSTSDASNVVLTWEVIN